MIDLDGMISIPFLKKTLFTGMHSFADKVLQKSTAISRAAAGSDKTYTNNATYSDTLSKLVSGTVDEEA